MINLKNTNLENILNIIKNESTDNTVIDKLVKNYEDLSDNDKNYINTKINELLSFNEQFQKKKEVYPNLIEQLYRLQLNALKVFLQKRLITDDKFSKEEQTKLITIINNILEESQNRKNIDQMLDQINIQSSKDISSLPTTSIPVSISTPASVPTFTTSTPTLESIIKKKERTDINIQGNDANEIALDLTSNMTNFLNSISRLGNLNTISRLGNMIGGSKKGIELLTTYLNTLLIDVKMFNSQIIIYILGLLSEPEVFNSFYKEIYGESDKKSFVDLFFININSYINNKNSKWMPKNLKTYLENKMNNTNINMLSNINNIIERDTYHYNNLIEQPENNNKYIFIYTLVILLGNEDPGIITHNVDNANGFFELWTEIVHKRTELITQINKTLITQQSIIKDKYNSIINKRNKIFTFIKERNDNKMDNTRNPRFTISTLKEDPKTLQLEYINVDNNIEGSYGTKQELLNVKMNNDNKQIEKYIFGPFDGIFLSDKNLSNKNIAFNIKDKIFDKIFIQKEDFCMIGYGQSGSGKTSTLIYFDKTKEDGIITELCNLEEFTDNVSEINIDITNIYLTHGSNITDMNDFQDKFYTTNNINFNPRTTHTSRQPIFKSNLTTFIYSEVQTSTQLQNMWHMKNSKLSIGEYILETFNKRIIEPTPNNPESSRSHVVITLTLQMKDENEKSRKLIICDLAGVENEFACESPEEIVKFSQKYATSIKYNSQDNLPQKNITLDRYACDQKQISENLNEINLYNDIQTKLNLIVSDHKFFTDMYNKFTGQTGGNCIESSNINNCSTEFKFKNIHNGNPNNENWLKFLNEINILVYPFIYGIKLKNIVVKYDKLKRGDNFTEINKEYKDMYNKIKNLTLYTKLEKPINIFNYDRLKKLKEENIKLYNYILSIHVKKSIELPDLTDEQRKYTIDNQVQWETNDKSLANLYKDILCEQQKLLIIPYNCILRRNEGYMI